MAIARPGTSRSALHTAAIVGATAASSLLFAGAARAITVDGTLDSGYGSPLTTQTINTGFGDATVGDGNSGGGSELDAAYGVEQGGNLYLFLSGNFENNGNRVNVFIADGRTGQNVLNLPATGNASAMNNSSFSPGFQATEDLDVNDYQGTEYVEEYSMVGGTGTGGYQGSFALSGGIGSGSPDTASASSNPFSANVTYALNNTNTGGVNGNTGTAADQSAADAVNTGLEIQIPLSMLGNPTGPIQVLADINGGNDSYLSNQFLPGLPVGQGNVGGDGANTGFEGPNSSTFNFSQTPGEFFTVSAAVPEPASLGLLGGLGTLLFARRRRAN